MMRTIREKNTPYRLSGIRRISRARKRPLNLADFFGEVPANPELCEQIFRAFANIDERTERNLTENEAFAHGVLAFIYMYPAVEMKRALDQYAYPTEKEATNVADGWNQLRVMRSYSGGDPTCDGMPDNHTLMCGAALDVSKEPVLLYTPDVGNRYFSYQFIDAHANTFSYIGTRATQGREGIFAIVGPGWRGKLSKGLSWIQSLTPHNLMIGRIYVGDPDEVPIAREIYYRSTLAPLSCFAKEKGNDLSILPPLDSGKRVDLNGLKWFEYANRVLNENPPPACENDMISLFAHLGIGPGFDFRSALLSPAVRSGLKRAIPVAKSQINQYADNMGEIVNGWRLTHLNRSIRETNYIERAAIAFQCLTQGSAEEIIYAEGKTDLQGRLLSGSKRYVLRFEKGKEPPVKGFWSLTLRGVSIHSNFKNEIETNSVRRRFRYEDDGSLEIYVQAESPGFEKESNWLPAPEGKFSLKLRMYIPGDEVVSGVYQLPFIQCLS